MTLPNHCENDNVISTEKEMKLHRIQEFRVTEDCNIFRPYRILGRICDHVHSVLQNRGSDFYITTSIGNAFQIYDCKHLRLLFVGSLPEQKSISITCIASHKDWTIVGCDTGDIYIYEMGKLITSHSFGSLVSSMECIGSIIYILQQNGKLSQYDLSTLSVSHISTIEHDIPICMIHPNTYVNKILIGMHSGTLLLWNIHTNKLIHTFQPFSSPITYLSQAPVLDIVAVGLENGTVILYHIRQDTVLHEICPLWMVHHSPITSISFRSDGHPHIAIANSQGSICIWDLEENRQHHLIDKSNHGHSSHVHVHYLPNQPILVSTSQDNSMKEWIFEGHGQSCRLLCYRDGHCSPPTTVAFYGTLRGGPELDEQQISEHFILSASRDKTLRQFSLYKDSQNVQLSSSSLGTLPPVITSMSYCHTRRRDWDNLVTCHQDQSYALTWRLENMSLGKHKLSSKDGSIVTQVLQSPCGHYTLLGCQSGAVDVFNIQSGIYQYSMSSDTKVIGMGMTMGNRYLIVAHSSGNINIWDYYDKKLVKSFNSQSVIVKFSFIIESNLFAIALYNGDILVYDLDNILNNSFIPVRKFNRAHSQLINGLCFRSDGMWLLSCGLDSYVKIWDLISGQLKTCILLSNIPLCIAISPNGDYLATCQVDSIGIHIHVNSSYYCSTVPNIDPIVFGHLNPWEPEKHHIFSDVATMSWKRLLYLDQIKERNKPKRPIKTPEKIPFFLTAVHGSKSSVVDQIGKNDIDTESIIEDKMIGEFGYRLQQAHESANMEEFHQYAKTLSYSSLDFELKTCSDNDIKRSFISYVSYCINRRQDLDFVFALLNVFLKSHYESLSKNLYQDIRELSTLIDSCWRELESTFQQTLCFIQYLKNNY